MNSIVCNPAEMELDIFCNTTETVTPEDMYATTPLVVVRPTYTQPNEEELHTSFEEAISDRVLAVNRQLRHLSIPLTDCLDVQSPARTPVKLQSLLARLTRPGYASRQALLYVAIALMLVMVGFDLMGLLVLQTR
jgi:hypothetical protein